MRPRTRRITTLLWFWFRVVALFLIAFMPPVRHEFGSKRLLCDVQLMNILHGLLCNEGPESHISHHRSTMTDSIAKTVICALTERQDNHWHEGQCPNLSGSQHHSTILLKQQARRTESLMPSLITLCDGTCINVVNTL